MRILVVMEAVDRVDPRTSTTFALMLAAHERGHRVEHCGLADLSLAEGRLWATARTAVPIDRAGDPIQLGPAAEVDVAGIDAVLVRADPPFDVAYLHATLLLEHVRGETLVVNDPRGLRDANEKLYACRFAELAPPTVVSAAHDRLIAFLDAHAAVVVKPLDGHGGRGVHLLRVGDPNVEVIVSSLTAGGTRPVVAQRYLPEVRRGDKRILVLDGEPLGAILRRPVGSDFRANIGVGGVVEAAALDAADRRIVEALAPSLRADGLVLVGLDVIGGLLTEVNVTSPTGIRQLAALTGGHPADRVLAWLEAAAGARPQGPVTAS